MSVLKEKLQETNAFKIKFTWREGISNWCQKAAGKQPGFKWATSFLWAANRLGEKDQQLHFKNIMNTSLCSFSLAAASIKKVEQH